MVTCSKCGLEVKVTAAGKPVHVLTDDFPSRWVAHDPVVGPAPKAAAAPSDPMTRVAEALERIATAMESK